MIVANVLGKAIEEVVVTGEQKNKLTKNSFGTFPMLEVDADTFICDSNAIVAYLVRSSGKSSLLGSNTFEEAQVDHWMDFLRSETMPLVKALQWQTFGNIGCTSTEYNNIYTTFKDNAKIINKHLNGKSYFVGNTLTVVDIYFALSQVEMHQIIMDSNFRNSLNFANSLFKNVIEQEAFRNRMGLIRQGKKQILPVFAKENK